ncbi:MAG: aryl-sulfate sulfotransferase, partial [Chloroflexota bacterium]
MTRRRRVSILTASGGSLLLALFYIFGLNQSLLAANQAELSLTYSSPRGGAEYVSAHQSLAIRVGDVISDTDLSVEHITLVGSVSGPIAGELQVAEDNLTLIFDPVAPFMPGESIEAEINGSLIDSETSAEPLILTFTVSPKALDAYQPVVFFPPPASPPPSVDFDALSYKSLPAPLPLITATRHSTSTSTSEGFLFLSNIRWGAFDQTFPYLLVLNESGEPVYTHSGTYGYPFLDFKQQVDESWTFFDTATDRYQRLDPLTGKIEPIHTGNGYFADVHELLILPNGNAVIMIYDEQPFDMSPVVEGGDPEATVTGLVLQEIEPSGNVIFQWRSWDYFEITDAQDYDLTTNDVDYAHGNSIEVDQDGHWIISSRTMDEVTKIS